MTARLGIAGKLLLAFGGISLLTVASALVGWFAFDRAGRVQETVVNQTVPFLSQALSLAEISGRIILLSPTLNNAADISRRDAAFADLSNEAKRLGALLDSLETAGTSKAALADLRDIAGRVVENIEKQNDLVGARISDQSRFSDDASRRRAAVSQIVDISGALVSNAVTAVTATVVNLYEMVEAPAGLLRMPETLDQLIEIDIDVLERMFELRHRSAVIGLLVGQLEHTTTSSDIDGLGERYATNLKIVERRVRHINDPYRRGLAAAALQSLGAGAAADAADTIFDLRRRVIEANTRMAGLAADNRMLFDDMQRRVDGLVTRSRAELRRAAAESETALSSGNIALLIIALASLVIASAIAWFYVRNRIARRIVRLSDVTRALADGNLGVEVQDTGNDELSEMAGVLKVFKASEQEKRRIEARQRETEAELRRHKEELELIVSDRTAQLREANERLGDEVARHDEARELAESANRAKTAFLASMSHEIRTPITGILGSLHLVDEKGLSPDQIRRLDVIRASGETLLSIINDILDYSKIESGRLDIVRADFDLVKLISDLTALLDGNADRKGLALTTEIAPDIPRYLKGDAGHLRQILINLIGNAIKFTDRGGVVLRVLPAAGDAAITLRFEVEDSGIGISAEDRIRLFDSFYQTQAAASRRIGGTGLGLTICKRLAEAMGGRIDVASTVGKGSTFAVTLGFERGGGDAEAADRRKRPASDGRALTVLVVEDSPVNREIVSAFLRRAGHSVVEADSGEAALSAINDTRFDAVLMDISLPGMDGRETARRIRADHRTWCRDVPIIAMSAHVFREEIDGYLAAGMNGFLGKPFTPEELAEVLGGAVAADTGTRRAVGGSITADTTDILNLASLDEDVEVLGRDRVAAIVELFLTTLPEMLDALSETARNEYWPDAARHAHTLKGAAASLGLMALHDGALAVETAAKGDRGAEAAERIGALAGIAEQSRAALIAFRDRLGSPDPVNG